MNEKNERNLDSTVDEIMEEIREQTVSEVKDINEKEQKSEERPRKKKVTKTKRPSGHHVSGDGVDHKAASGEDRPVKKKRPGFWIWKEQKNGGMKKRQQYHRLLKVQIF